MWYWVDYHNDISRLRETDTIFLNTCFVLFDASDQTKAVIVKLAFFHQKFNKWSIEAMWKGTDSHYVIDFRCGI